MYTVKQVKDITPVTFITQGCDYPECKADQARIFTVANVTGHACVPHYDTVVSDFVSFMNGEETQTYPAPNWSS